MDLASLIGFFMCLGMVLFGIISSTGSISGISSYIDPASAIITFGGAFAATMCMNTMGNFVGGLKSLLLIFKSPVFDVKGIITKIIDLSNVARKDGLLALEEAANELDDAFMKKGILLIVDGTDPDLVRGILETEMVACEDRHKSNIQFWEDLGGMGPAWGMIGTLIGLINMLNDLSDINAVGPNMAVALITTLYGSMLANWICAPVGAKLKNNNNNEMMVKNIVIEGLLSIQAGENPRVIEEKLKSFLAPADRAAASDEGGEADG
ncbi:MAG: motility protein A [Lachnospiraceae bacterium]|nr:motility protein A [Lachnospiraceae bacterium]